MKTTTSEAALSVVLNHATNEIIDERDELRARVNLAPRVFCVDFRVSLPPAPWGVRRTVTSGSC